MESNKTKLQKSIKSYKMLLISAFILIVIVVLCAIKGYEKSKLPIPEPEVMVNVNSSDKYASIDVQLLSDPFAEDDETKYYFSRDKDNYTYIVVLNDDDVARLKGILDYTYSEDVNAETPNPVKIQGVTQEIPLDLKKIAIESYNEIFDETLLDNENFEEYMGTVYLNTRMSPVDYGVEICIGSICGLFAILLIVLYIKALISTKLTIKKYTLNGSLEYIYSQLDELDTLVYGKGKVFLTREYIIDTCEGLVILEYDDIKWIYPSNVEQYGITTGRYAQIVKNDKTKLRILGDSKFLKKEIFDTVYNEICARTPNALKGYTEENKKIIANK